MRWGFAGNGAVDQAPDTVQLAVCDERVARVSQVLGRYLPAAEYKRCWSKWQPVLQQQQLFAGTPFKNVVGFVQSVAREYGLDPKRQRGLRKALFALSFSGSEERRSHASKTFQVRRDQIKHIRYNAPGLTKFESATMVVTSPTTVILMTKRGLLLQAPVKILLQNEIDDTDTPSGLLFHGRVRKISTQKLGACYKYRIKVENTELKTAAR